MRRISVVIADRYPVVLLGLMKVLEAHPDFAVVACCTDGISCIEAMRRLAPDITVLDLPMSGSNGFEVLNAANSENLPTRLVFFTASIQNHELNMAAVGRAFGVIMKDAPPEILARSLRQVADGQRLLPLLSLDDVSLLQMKSAITDNALSMLTDRERQIVHLVSEGLSNKVIGRRLNVADGTIKQHLHHIYQKLEIDNRTALAALAISLPDRRDLADEG